jgi:hypothetical protein
METLQHILPLCSKMDSKYRKDSVHHSTDLALTKISTPTLSTGPHPQTRNSRRKTTKLRLTDLPNELLLHITSYLRASLPPRENEDRFDGRERILFVRSTRSLLNISITCRKLHPIAQEVLLHTIILGGFDGLPAIVSLVRFLFHRPEACRHVKRLRIGLPPNKQYFFKNEKAARDEKYSSAPLGPPPPGLYHPAFHLILDTPLPKHVRAAWQAELKVNYARPVCGLLIVLLEKLEWLSVGHSLGMASREGVLREMFGCGKCSGEIDLTGLTVLKNSRNLNGERRVGVVLPALT